MHRRTDIVDDRYFTLDELRAFKLSDKYQATGIAVAEIAYHLLPSDAAPQKRIVEHTRTLFFDTSLDKPLLLGQLNALGLPYESYKLALSDEILRSCLPGAVHAAGADGARGQASQRLPQWP